MSTEQNGALLIPSEILDKHPNLKRLGWQPRDLGRLANLGLVKAKRPTDVTTCFLDERDFERLLDFAGLLEKVDANQMR